MPIKPAVKVAPENHLAPADEHHQEAQDREQMK
jgi:hypothetical protein